MKTITFADFKKEDGYMSYKNDKFEICLEPCFNGCDVAIYDVDQNLLKPKVCTNVDLLGDVTDIINVREKAQEIFQKFYNEVLRIEESK